MNANEGLWRVALLLADARQCFHRGKLDLQESSFVIITANRDLVATRPRDRGELGKDTMGGIRRRCFCRWLGQPVGLNAHEEPRPEILREAEEFVDVAFPIAYVHAALGRASKRDGMTQILKPAIAFLRLDRHACLIHEPLERGRSGTVNLTWALRDEAFSFAFGYAALLIPEISRHAAKAAAR